MPLLVIAGPSLLYTSLVIIEFKLTAEPNIINLDARIDSSAQFDN